MKSNLLSLFSILFSSCLVAQNAGLGVQGSIASPQGELKSTVNNGMGFGVGLFKNIKLNDNNQLRPRLDILRFTGKENSYTTTLVTSTFQINGNAVVTDLGLGMDYLYHFDSSTTGVYTLIGLSYIKREIDNKWAVTQLSGPPVQFAPNSTQKSNEIGGTFGLGWKFNSSVGAEIGYAKHGSYGIFKASFVFTF